MPSFRTPLPLSPVGQPGPYLSDALMMSLMMEMLTGRLQLGRSSSVTTADLNSFWTKEGTLRVLRSGGGSARRLQLGRAVGWGGLGAVEGDALTRDEQQSLL